MKKEIFIFIIIALLFAAFLMFAAYRVDTIQNNPNAYTETGHAHSVKLK